MALNILSYLKRSAPTQELRINLALKVTIFITVSIFLVASITAAIILNHNYRTIIRQIKGQLLSAASTTALTLDTEQLLSVRNQGDENSSAYKNLQKHLQNMIAASNGQFKYIYMSSPKSVTATNILLIPRLAIHLTIPPSACPLTFKPSQKPWLLSANRS